MVASAVVLTPSVFSIRAIFLERCYCIACADRLLIIRHNWCSATRQLRLHRSATWPSVSSVAVEVWRVASFFSIIPVRKQTQLVEANTALSSPLTTIAAATKSFCWLVFVPAAVGSGTIHERKGTATTAVVATVERLPTRKRCCG